MPPTPSLNVRPTFTRAVTDESIIPMAHLDRRPSVQSVSSQNGDNMSTESGRRESYFEIGPPLSRVTSHTSTMRPMMQPPHDSPVHTGPETGLARAQAALMGPFRPQGLLYEGASWAGPHWREGVFVATTVGLAVWLGIMTGRVRQMENIPFCVLPEG